MEDPRPDFGLLDKFIHACFIIAIFSIFTIALSLFIQFGIANAQLSIDTIQSALEDSSIKGCEYISIVDMQKPVRFEAIYPSTDNVDPQNRGLLDRDSEFSASFTETRYNFETNATDNFQITLRLDYPNGVPTRDADNNPVSPNVFYEFVEKDSVRSESGNWLIENNSICKIIDFWTIDPIHERTEEELAIIFQDYTVEQFDEIIDDVSDVEDVLTVVTVIVIVAFVLVFTLVYLQWKAGNEDSKERNKLKKMMNNSTEKFDEAKNSLLRFIQYNQLKITAAIEDLVIVASSNVKPSEEDNVYHFDSAQKESQKSDSEIYTDKKEEKPISKKVSEGIKSLLQKDSKEDYADFETYLSKLNREQKVELFDNYKDKWDNLTKQERKEFDIIYDDLNKGDKR